MDCINDIVGVSLDQSCLPVGVNNLSKSGLYLDDTSSGRLPLKQAFWGELDIINRVVPNAVSESVRQLLMSLNNRLRPTMPPHLNLNIGYKDDWSGVIESTENKYLSLKAKSSDAIIVFKSMPEFYSTTGKENLTPKIYKGGIDVTPTSYPFRIAANEVVYVVFETTLSARNFKHVPCCSDTPPYLSFLQVASGLGDTLEFKRNDYSNGIFVNVGLECDGLSFLCDLDYKNSVFGVVFAKMVQQIARRNIAHYILTNDNLSPYLIANADELNLILEYLNEDITKMVNYLPENYNHTSCFVCNGLHRHDKLV